MGARLHLNMAMLMEVSGLHKVAKRPGVSRRTPRRWHLDAGTLARGEPDLA